MLFRGLIDRLLGTSELLDNDKDKFATSSRLAWDSYPGFLDLLVELLEPLNKMIPTGDESDVAVPAAAERIFPILDLLKKALPPASYRQTLRQSMLAACNSSHWHVRDIAARAYAATSSLERAVEEVTTLVHEPAILPNALHGQLLCIRFTCAAVIGECPREQGMRWTRNLNSMFVADQLRSDTSGSSTTGSGRNLRRASLEA